MALVLQRKGHSVSLWEYDAEQAARVSAARTNEKFLPGVMLPDGLEITSEMDRALKSAEICLLAVPAQSCRSVLKAMSGYACTAVLVSLMKGVERDTLNRVSEICVQECRNCDPLRYAVISGPTVAPEVAAGLPTSAVVASRSPGTAELVQKEFSSRGLRLYTSDDVVGVELAGALKNVIALAAGICDGLGLGFNTKGTLLTRGLAEIMRLGTALGGSRQTFSGLSGIGDLVTTCTSPNSRNRSVGERIGRGETVADILGNMVMVAEGVWTARAANDLAHNHSIEMPITSAVCAILDDGKNPRDAVTELMGRNLKAED
jgi:glycerol-3-phosphate dehydrogenase (NAD(P)+)